MSTKPKPRHKTHVGEELEAGRLAYEAFRDVFDDENEFANWVTLPIKMQRAFAAAALANGDPTDRYDEGYEDGHSDGYDAGYEAAEDKAARQ